MPLAKIVRTDQRIRGIWKIEEDEQSLALQVAPFETLPATLSNPLKRLEWLAGRVLVKTLMEKMTLSFQGVTKNEHGKPFPTGCNYQLALSHSYPYVAALLDAHAAVGIDLEQPKPKLLKIAPRVLDATELLNAGDDLIKHCIYWCAKESLVKVYGKKDLIFAQNLKISPFELAAEGDIVGRIIVRGIETKVPLHYAVTAQYVTVWS